MSVANSTINQRHALTSEACLLLPTIELTGSHRIMSSMIRFVTTVGAFSMAGVADAHLYLEDNGLMTTFYRKGDHHVHRAVNRDNLQAVSYADAETFIINGGQELTRVDLASLVEDQVAIDAATHALQLRFRNLHS